MPISAIIVVTAANWTRKESIGERWADEKVDGGDRSDHIGHRDSLRGWRVVGLKGTTSTISTFTQPQTGEYLSSEVVLNSSSVVVVRPPSSIGGLVPAQALNDVNSTSLATYARPANSTLGGSATYVSLQGDYYYVIFTASQPATKIVITADFAKTAESGILVLLGGILFLAGLIVTIIGAIRKGDRPKQTSGVTDADYYSKRRVAPRHH